MTNQQRPRDSEHSATALVNQSGLNVLGGVVNAASAFLLTVVVTRSLGAHDSAFFFEALALFSVLLVVGQAGSSPTVVRGVAIGLTRRRYADVRGLILVSAGSVVIVTSVLGCTLYYAAPRLAMLLHAPQDGGFEASLRILALALPIGGLAAVLLSATRGFGTILPWVTLDSIGKPLVRLLAVAIAIRVYGSATAATIAWATALPVTLMAVLLWIYRLLEHLPKHRDRLKPVSRYTITRDFARTSLPQLVSEVFQVGTQWLDILLVGALGTATQTGIYSVVSRFVMVGTVGLVGVGQVLAPRLASLLATERLGEAERLYQAATAWLQATSLPIYILIAVYPAAFLSIFGSGFGSGAVPLTLLALGMMTNIGTGPVLILLLMGGRTALGMVDAGISLAANIALNVVLIPLYGINGAAIAWVVSIVLSNVLPLVQVHHIWGIAPFTADYWRICAIAVLSIGGTSLFIRLFTDDSVLSVTMSALVGVPIYLLALRRTRIIVDARSFWRARLSTAMPSIEEPPTR